MPGMSTDTQTQTPSPEAIRAAAVHAFDNLRPKAAKRGRNPEYPYVPIVEHYEGPNTRTEQILGFAFAEKADAVAHAFEVIERRKWDLERKLSQPRYRALREHHGLPREINR